MSLDALADAIKHAGELLEEDLLEPDSSRSDWGQLRARVQLARQAMDEVLRLFPPALAEARETGGGAGETAEAEALQRLMRQRVSELCARAAVLFWASGDVEGMRWFMAEATRLCQDDEQRSLLEAGAREPRPYARYHHALWLWRRGRIRPAGRELRQVRRESRERALRDAALRASALPRPISSAPALFRINGCGVSLYGRRDAAEDGTYVATYCLALLFIPVLPLTAYRVRDGGDGSYQFFARVALGPIARLWQGVVLAGVLLAVAVGAAQAYRESPGRLARLALEDARRLESAGSPEKALERYRTLIAEYPRSGVQGDAAEALVRLELARLERPCTPAVVEPARRAVTGFRALPLQAPGGPAAAHLAEELARCASEVEQATIAGAQAGLALLDLAAEASGNTAAGPVEERRRRARLELAGRVATERPLQALALYVQTPRDETAMGAAGALIDGLGDGPSLWLEAEPHVRAWVARAAQVPARKETAARFSARLEAARAAHAKDEELIASGDARKLARAFKSSPQDQELAVELAQQARHRGDVKTALAILAGLGPPGRLTGWAQALLGGCHLDTGQIARADEVLSGFLDERGAAFQQAQGRYAAAATQAQERLIGQARMGQLPGDLVSRLERAKETDQQELLREWITSSMEKDDALNRLRAEYLRHEAVVPAALTLGTVKLRRAAEAEGEARTSLLRGAEQAFLSIRQQAEGEPRFHLGLGQVYHRLGRREEGDRELESVLARKDPELSLEVASVYRELGLTMQARTVAEEVYGGSPSLVQRHSAAALRAHLAEDLEEHELWLRRSDLGSPAIQENLLEVQAQRAMYEGREAEADQAWSRVIKQRERAARHSAAAANNAAMGYFGRYWASGDPAHLRAAVRHLENAARLAPDNAVVLGNLGDALQHLGLVTVLEQWVRTGILRPGQQNAQILLDWLLSGELGGQVRQAMARQPELLRSVELAQREQVLSPQKVGAWDRQSRWLAWREDEAGLAAMARRLEALPPMDNRQQAEDRRKWESGARDGELSKQAARFLKQAEAARDRARQSHHPPTLAAAAMLVGLARSQQFPFDRSPEQLDAMVVAHREACRTWPSGGGRFLAAALMQAAVEQSASQSPALAAALDAERRTFSPSMLLHRLLGGSSAEEVRRALRARPELREAVAVTRKAPGRPALEDWILARVAGDADLERQTAAAFDRADLKWMLEIESRLSGGLEREAAKLELYRSRGRPAGAP